LHARAGKSLGGTTTHYGEHGAQTVCKWNPGRVNCKIMR